MIKKIYNEDMTKFMLEYLAEQILSDNIDSIDNLAIMPIAKDEEKLSAILSARDIMRNYIKNKTNKPIEKFHLDLTGYFNNIKCGQHKFPFLNTLNMNYIIFTDNFNDPLLIRHAHYFISKFGVSHKKIKIGTLIHASETFKSKKINSIEYDNSNKIFKEKNRFIKPKYVGIDNQYEEFNGYNPETFKLIKKNDKLFIGL